MPPIADTTLPATGFAPLRRFLPYLWPANDTALRMRVVVALAAGAGRQGRDAGDALRLQGGDRPDDAGAASRRSRSRSRWSAAYAAARFGGVLFDNLRNAIFERVGQDATRRLSANVFEHLHGLSLRFHLERRTGAVTKVVERGTKSIDMMLYFLLFNIAPTVIELVAVARDLPGEIRLRAGRRDAGDGRSPISASRAGSPTGAPSCASR